MSEELKPCPFCGSNKTYPGPKFREENDHRTWRSGCMDCPAQMPSPEEWNTRATPTPDLDALAKEVYEEVEDKGCIPDADDAHGEHLDEELSIPVIKAVLAKRLGGGA